jgi:hypothetical protein
MESVDIGNDRDARNVVSQLLGTGEALLWAGRPRQGVILRGSDVFLIPFSLMWGGFAIFWESSVILSGAPFFFMLWGIPFVLVGLYLIVGRFFVDSWMRARTYYGVTTDRAVIHKQGLGQHTTSLDRARLPNIQLVERKDGRATIRLGSTPAWGRMYEGFQWPGAGRHMPPSFEQISDGRRVFDLLRTKA